MQRFQYGSTKRWGRRAAWTIAMVVGLGLFALPAVADEGKPERGAKQTEDTLDAFLADFDSLKKDRNKDVEALVRLCRRGSLLYDEATTDEQRQALVDGVGKIPSIKRIDELEVAALDALGEMGDPDGARYIRRYLKLPRTEDASETLKAAIKSAGQVPHKSLVAPLLKLLDKAKVIHAKRLAATALSNFGGIKSHRTRILAALISVTKQAKPGGPSRNRGGSEPDPYGGGTAPGHAGGPSDVWSALSPMMTSALNRLTGQDVRTLENWFGIYNSNKRNASTLFVDND